MIKEIFYADDFRGFYLNKVELNIKGNFILPKNATYEKPNLDIPNNKVNKLVDKKWVIVDNPDIVRVYNKENQMESLVSKYNIPIGYTELKPNTQDDIFYNGKWDLESNVISELKKKMINKINTRTRNKIESGYESSILGQPHIYDSSLTDQFEIDFLSRQNSGYKIKCTPLDGIKRRILHTSTQINQLANEFMLYVSELKVVADGEKTSILENPYTIQELELMIESIS